MPLTTKRPSKVEETRQRIIQEMMGETEKKRRLNAPIEETLYQRIKIQAAREGRTISDITRSLWLEYLSKYSNE